MTSKTACVAMSLLSVALLAASPALAQSAPGSFGRDQQFILSADRLFGLSFASVSSEDSGGASKDTTSTTTISLLWTPLSTLASPYQIPRIGFDFVVASGFTVGGSAGFVSSTGTVKTEPANGPSVERDRPSSTMFAVAPRIGYALPLSAAFAFWPRAGVTYYSFKSESTSTGMNPVTTKTTTNGFGFDLEAMFVFSPASHFGITATPLLDLPLSGSSSRETTPSTGPAPADQKVKFTNFGLSLGLLGYF